jgi:hypothetical protein
MATGSGNVNQHAYTALPPRLDLATAEGARWFIDHLKEAAGDIFCANGELHFMAIVLARRDPKTRLSFAKVRLIPVLVEGDRYQTAASLRSIAT